MRGRGTCQGLSVPLLGGPDPTLRPHQVPVPACLPGAPSCREGLAPGQEENGEACTRAGLPQTSALAPRN